jgi:hypothetical protein
VRESEKHRDIEILRSTESRNKKETRKGDKERKTIKREILRKGERK